MGDLFCTGNQIFAFIPAKICWFEIKKKNDMTVGTVINK